VFFEPPDPLVQRRTCRVRISPRRVRKTWKREFRICTFKNTSSSPQARTNKRYHSLTVCSLQLPPRMRFQTDMLDIVIQLYNRFQWTGRFGKPYSGATDKRNQPPQIIVCLAACLLYQTETVDLPDPRSHNGQSVQRIERTDHPFLYLGGNDNSAEPVAG